MNTIKVAFLRFEEDCTQGWKNKIIQVKTFETQPVIDCVLIGFKQNKNKTIQGVKVGKF